MMVYEPKRLSPASIGLFGVVKTPWETRGGGSKAGTETAGPETRMGDSGVPDVSVCWMTPEGVAKSLRKTFGNPPPLRSTAGLSEAPTSKNETFSKSVNPRLGNDETSGAVGMMMMLIPKTPPTVTGNMLAATYSASASRPREGKSKNSWLLGSASIT